ncbi:MAG: flagellar protein FlaG [Woeseiaceae bacterium]|nr:flagellar protein FlaG [Woeseiaceae bacterium]
MSEQDVRNISAVTGSYPALRSGREPESASGKQAAAAGKNVPEDARPNTERLVQKLNVASQSIGRDLRFEVDLENGRSVIQVLDRETGEIIRQIPPENARTYLSDIGDLALRLYDAMV